MITLAYDKAHVAELKAWIRGSDQVILLADVQPATAFLGGTEIGCNGE